MGSTELGERLDPELMRKVMARCFDAIRTAGEPGTPRLKGHSKLVERVGDPTRSVRRQNVASVSSQLFVNFSSASGPSRLRFAGLRKEKRPCDQGPFLWALEDLNLWPLPRQGSALPLS